MGIKGMTNFIKDSFNVCSEELDFEVDHLYYDFNNKLYNFSFQNFTHIKNRIEDDLNKEISYIKPKKSVFFSLDGPAPLSKIPLQKASRLKRNKPLIEKLKYFAYKKQEESKEKDKSIFSFMDDNLIEPEFKSNISPGTYFMGCIKSFLYYYILNQTSSKFFPKKSYISASDREGEGEWKIFEHLNHSNFDINDNVLIFTSDSDIIISSLLSNHKNIYIQNGATFINVAKLRESLYTLKNAKTDKEKRQVLVAFTILSMFRGSDHFPALTGYLFYESWDKYLNSEKIMLYDEETDEFDLELLNSVVFTNDSRFVIDDIEFQWRRVIQSFKTYTFKDLSCNNNSIYEEGNLVLKDTSKADFIKIDHPFWEEYKKILDNSANRNDSTSLRHLYALINLVKNPPLREVKLPAAQFSLVKEAVKWNLKYHLGQCDNFSFCLPFFKFEKDVFIQQLQQQLNKAKEVNQLKEVNKEDIQLELLKINDDNKPLSSLLYGFLIMDYTSKSLYPTIIHRIYHSFPKFFSFDSLESTQEFYKNASISSIKKEFYKLLEHEKDLTKYQKSQLINQPTLLFEFDDKNKLVTLKKEIGRTHSYEKVKSFNYSKVTFSPSQLFINNINNFNTNFYINNHELNSFNYNNKFKNNNNQFNNNNNQFKNNNTQFNNNNKFNNNNHHNNNVFINKSKLESSKSQQEIRSFTTKSRSSFIYNFNNNINNNRLFIISKLNVFRFLKK